MKKSLVVLLALAMIFAIAVPAMAADTAIPDYSDTTTSTDYAVDIYRLTALGVLEGNTGWGGAYRPTEYLTRAEFAKIACYMFGKQDYVNYYAAQKSAFADVPEGLWAEGWINCAYDNGLMIGVGGGNFAPNANVTKQEVATVTLRAVGYTDELPGAWPTDYINKSQKVIAQWNDETLFDYVEKIDGTAATRAEMAAIVNYCLDLYKVTYVGDQNVVYGIGDADADGYAYETLKTNEADLYDYFLGADIDLKGKVTFDLKDGLDGSVTLDVDPKVTTKATLLWNVFHAIEVPYLFELWDAGYGEPREGYFNPQYVEASGWGYEDFKKGELVFSDELTKSTIGHDEQGLLLPVASDYYIYDDSLDGELWNVGGRLANLTIVVDPTKTKVAKLTKGNLSGLEAVFAEMLTDVEYTDKETEIKYITGEKVKFDNADIFSLDLDGFFGAKDLNDLKYAYDYDWFLDDDIAIVKKVAADEITVDDNFFGEGGIFCILDGCKKHDQNYVFLKDGQLQDASCLELNDVLYYAGDLAENDIELYIVYSPVSGTFDELINGYADHLGIVLSGDDYLYCDYGYAHAVSYDGGYKDGSYVPMFRDELRDKLTDEDFDGSCLYAIGYGKKYVASLIFAADEVNKGYGVLVTTTEKMQSPDPDDWYAVDATIFGPDGEKNTYDLSKTIDVGNSRDNTYVGDWYYGWIGNYTLTSKGELDVSMTGSNFNTLGVPGNNDVGFIALDPKDHAQTFHTDDRGFFSDTNMIDNFADDAEAGGFKSFKDMYITADTKIFEITLKDGKFKSVALGDPDDYIDATFQANQIEIFAWSGSKITALYVVSSVDVSDTLFGLFDFSRVDAGGDYAAYEDGTKVYFTEDQIAYLPDGLKFYAGYRTKDNKVEQLTNGAVGSHMTPGDFVLLVGPGGLIGSQSADEALIKEYVDGVARVRQGGIDSVATSQLYGGTVYYDMIDEADADYAFEDGYFSKVDHEDDDFIYVQFRDEYGKILVIFRCYGI